MTMTKDERDELLKDASTLAYQTIRFTGLYKQLSSDEWNGLAERLGRVTLSYIEALADEEFTRIQSEADAAEAFAERAWSGHS
jgi:hypothetical protein